VIDGRFQSASALASGRSDNISDRHSTRTVSIRVRSRERTMCVWLGRQQQQ